MPDYADDTVTVITPVPDVAPIAGDPPFVIDLVDRGTGAVIGHLNVSHGAEDPIVYNVVAGVPNPDVGVVYVDRATGQWAFQPTTAARAAAWAAGRNGSVTFAIAVSDGVHVTTVAVEAPVDAATAPHAGDPAFTLTGIDATSAAVSGHLNVADADGDTLTYSLSTPFDPTLGTVAIDSAAGTFVFTPRALARYHSWFDPDARTATFNVTATDGTYITRVNVLVPITALHPDQDGTLTATELAALAYNGDVGVGINADGSIRAIDGTFTVATVHDAAGAAAVLDHIAALLGAPVGGIDARDIVRQSVVQADGTYVEDFYRLNRTVGGVPVLGGSTILAVNGDGVVTGVFGGYDPRIDSVDTRPGASMADQAKAFAAARAVVAAGLSITLDPAERDAFLASLTYDGELAIYAADPAESPALAWRVTVSVPADPDTSDPELEAPNPGPLVLATFLLRANGADAATVLANIAPDLGLWVPTSQQATDLLGDVHEFEAESKDGLPLAQHRLHDAGRDIWTYVLHTSRQQTATELTTLGNPANKDGFGWNPHYVSAAANVAAVYDFYRDILGRRSIDGQGRQIKILIVDQLDQNGLFANQKGFGLMVLGNGYWTGLDAVAHEYTHGVNRYLVGDGGQIGIQTTRQGAALEEAYADIMSNLIEGKVDDGRWLIGEDGHCGRVGGCTLEDLSDPSNYGQLENFSQFDLNGDPQDNSTIFGYAAYKMMTDRRNADVFTEIWARIYYDSLYRLSPGASFGDAAIAVISSVKTLGLSTNQVTAVRNAFREVGIGVPDKPSQPVDLMAYSPIPLPSVGDFSVGQNGSWVYVANGRVVSVVDANGRTVDGEITVGGYSTAVAAATVGSRVYVGVAFEDATGQTSVEVVDAYERTVVGTIPLGVGTDQPVTMKLSPDGRYLYVGTLNSRIVVVDTVLRTTKVIDLTHGDTSGLDLAVSPDGKFIYATPETYSTSVPRSQRYGAYVIDAAAGKVVAKLFSGGSDVELNAAGSLLYQSTYLIQNNTAIPVIRSTDTDTRGFSANPPIRVVDDQGLQHESDRAEG